MHGRNRFPSMPPSVLVRVAFAAGLSAAVLLGGLSARDKAEVDEKQIAKLIEQLGDDDLDTRKAAEKKLMAIGEPALDQVKKAAAGAADADVKLRAILLARAIEKGVYGEIRKFVGHKGDIRHLAVSRDGKRILSGSMDHSVRLWDTETGKELKEFEGHKGWTWSVAFSPDEKKVLSSGSFDKTMRLWTVEDAKEERQFDGQKNFVYGAAFSPDGKHVLSSGAGAETPDQMKNNEKADHTLRLYEADTGKEVRTFEGHTGWVWKVCFSPDGKKIASAGLNDKSFRIWDAETGNTLVEGKDAHDGNVTGVAFSPDGKQLLTCGRDLTVKLWDVEKGTLVRKYVGVGDNVESIAFSKDGKRFLAGETKQVHVFDTESGKILHRFEDHVNDKGEACEVLAVAFLPDGKRAVSGGKDQVIRLWGLPK